LKNFGYVDEVTVVAPGINGKMSEFNAALGLLQLAHVDAAIARRKTIDAFYRESLASVPGVQCLPLSNVASANYSYFPILLNSDYGLSRDALYEEMKRNNIFPRRYFYPLIADFPMYRRLPSAQKANLPVANDAADRVLCLPIYPSLEQAQIEKIASVIAGNA
jgi:dTDP-4-amino-4,6-dideoxygalactose transaminase